MHGIALLIISFLGYQTAVCAFQSTTPTIRTTMFLSSMQALVAQRSRSVLPFVTPAAMRIRGTVFALASTKSGRNEKVVDEGDAADRFVPGQKIQVEILSFGPLGASVDVIGHGHNPDDVLPEGEPPLGRGLILQKEIKYFREARDGVDVVRGEVLPAYVERTRENGRIDVGLRSFGGKAKAEDLSQVLLERLRAKGGELQVGDKSPPEDIGAAFPGTSKSAFKKAVARLYKEGKVKPGPFSIKLIYR